MLTQDFDTLKRQMSSMTPRMALLAKKTSTRNADKKSFDFNTAVENMKKENSGLSAEELENCLNERNEELDELREQFELLEAENEKLIEENEEMQHDLDEAEVCLDEYEQRIAEMEKCIANLSEEMQGA